ncbi:SDR family NAD(P)-dependent oxidoreductase [Phenylobacterium sp.]|uniref:SDR family NAD(P)-dependent oxidoreductase n=1 Tax=Phenylobacterium sp. TaxID=1871053 RepID=UPI0027322036|nr:SDR family oxidoreductase [Phenylobacterium sp.]MDP1875319.1 SDR family oxidoreductase [Phenylobacterium sp.]
MPESPPHILVTGATRGIGAAIVQSLVERGARVVGHGTKPAPGILAADLSEAGAGDRLWDAALAALDGRIDVLINNAGVFEAIGVDAPDADWQASWARTMQINLQGSADLCRRMVLHATARQPDAGALCGRIVNVASRAAYRGDSPAHWHYAASKAGMVAMTKSIARGYAGQGLSAFAICPGYVMTGMADDYLASRGGDKLLADIPLGRVAQPQEVASVATYLALDAPASMTGAVLDVNGASFVR